MREFKFKGTSIFKLTKYSLLPNKMSTAKNNPFSTHHLFKKNNPAK